MHPPKKKNPRGENIHLSTKRPGDRNRGGRCRSLWRRGHGVCSYHYWGRRRLHCTHSYCCCHFLLQIKIAKHTHTHTLFHWSRWSLHQMLCHLKSLVQTSWVKLWWWQICVRCRCPKDPKTELEKQKAPKCVPWWLWR
jgi:hypothetical protein